jgi:hypothetical protein
MLTLLAQIKNPVLSEELGSDAAAASSGTTFVTYAVFLWQAMMTIGALLLIFYLVWGSLEWIYAAGDAGKIQKARDKMTQAVIGLVILVSSFVIIAMIGQIFFSTTGFDILNPTLPGTKGGQDSGGGTSPIFRASQPQRLPGAF